MTSHLTGGGCNDGDWSEREGKNAEQMTNFANLSHEKVQIKRFKCQRKKFLYRLTDDYKSGKKLREIE